MHFEAIQGPVQQAFELPYQIVKVIMCAGPGAHDLLKIVLNGRAGAASAHKQQQTMLLPFVKEFVPIIDEEKQAIYICPPPGLLELAMAPPSKGKSKKAPIKQQAHHG